VPPLAGSTGRNCRPNGDDPHSSIFELWTLQELAPGEDPSPVPPVRWVADWHDHDWGLVVNQDLANFEAVQRGLRVPDGPPLRWNHRQDQRQPAKPAEEHRLASVPERRLRPGAVLRLACQFRPGSGDAVVSKRGVRRGDPAPPSPAGSRPS
jgi:hypothetical protein